MFGVVYDLRCSADENTDDPHRHGPVEAETLCGATDREHVSFEDFASMRPQNRPTFISHIGLAGASRSPNGEAPVVRGLRRM